MNTHPPPPPPPGGSRLPGSAPASRGLPAIQGTALLPVRLNRHALARQQLGWVIKCEYERITQRYRKQATVPPSKSSSSPRHPPPLQPQPPPFHLLSAPRPPARNAHAPPLPAVQVPGGPGPSEVRGSGRPNPSPQPLRGNDSGLATPPPAARRRFVESVFIKTQARGPARAQSE